MTQTKQNINGEDNDDIISYALLQEFKKARPKLNPTAEDILKSIPTYRVVMK